MDDVVWLSHRASGKSRFMRVRAKAQRFHVAAGWSVVDEADVPDEVRNPIKARPVRRERPAPKPRPARTPRPGPPEASTVAAPRRRNPATPAATPVEEN